MATTNRVEIESLSTPGAMLNLEHTLGDDVAFIGSSRGKRICLDEARLRELKEAVDAALDDVADANFNAAAAEPAEADEADTHPDGGV